MNDDGWVDRFAGWWYEQPPWISIPVLFFMIGVAAPLAFLGLVAGVGVWVVLARLLGAW